MTPKVLITGAAGRIAKAVIPRLSSHFDLRLTDREPGEIEGIEVAGVDLTDYGAVLAVMEGMDAVVHLAIASNREFITDVSRFEADEGEEYLRFNEATIDVNVRGTYHLFEAARAQKVKRIVYGSSLTVMMGKPAYPEFGPDLPPRPSNFYAVSKLFGEALGEYFSRQHGVSVISLRFGTPHPQPEHPKFERWLRSARSMGCMVTFDDLGRAIRGALAAKQVEFGVYNVVSLSDAPYIDVQNGSEIGWQPRDFCHADGRITQVPR